MQHLDTNIAKAYSNTFFGTCTRVQNSELLQCIKSIFKDKHIFGICVQNSELFNNVTANSDKCDRCVVSCFYEANLYLHY